MAAVRHPDIADGAAVPGRGTEGSRRDGRGERAFDLHLSHLAAPRAADHRGHPDRNDLPADRVRRDLCHDRRRPRPGDHQYRVPDLLAGAGPVRCRQRLGRWTGRGRDRQYRGLLPGADRRAESGGVSDGTQGDGETRMGVHGSGVAVWISDHHALNSIIVAGGSTLIAMIIAIPAAWSMAFSPTPRTKDVLLWMLSTKMMPSVGVLVPIYLIFRDFGMLDTRAGLVMILCLGNLPIVIWMLFTYFKEIPKDILEAARMDGATIGRELIYVLAPMAIPGLASTLLLNFILAWNEAFWTLNLSTLDAAPLTVFIASYSSPEGLFWAKLSAASTLAIAPIIVLGWFTQRQLVRGLTFGAVK